MPKGRRRAERKAARRVLRMAGYKRPVAILRAAESMYPGRARELAAVLLVAGYAAQAGVLDKLTARIERWEVVD